MCFNWQCFLYYFHNFSLNTFYELTNKAYRRTLHFNMHGVYVFYGYLTLASVGVCLKKER